MRYFLIYFFLSLPGSLLAQNFELMRYNENYSGLKDSNRTFYKKVKYMPLSQNGSAYLSVGGELRQELDYAVNEDWGEKNLGRDAFLLQRYHLHADLHLSNRIRVFGQLRSGLEDGRKNGPRGIDEDKLNIQNLFVDIIPYKKPDRTLTLRIGRQEIQYGSGRLIDVREGTNLRLYFDGAKVAYTSPHFNVDAFILAEAKVNTGVFDNISTRKINLWGIYSTYSIPKSHKLDLYYLGIDRINSRFDEGIANETRHTTGARFSKNGGGLIYNFEAIYQFGKFGSDAISALGISSEIGYIFDRLKGVPTVKLKSDYIPGDDKKNDGKLGTANPLYPNGGYFGMNPQIGPANLISIHPTLSWNPHKKVTLKFDVVFNWRQSTEDGVYRSDGSLRLSSSGSRERYIGTAYITNISWDINGFLNYNFGVQYFKTGSFINDLIPQHQNGFFVASVVGFKF
ncbi:alginate export family protein [Mucilaginibacter sp. JRF]|uniref:alginate export family protein n=1 Tax=Mucilaginibacter sp. JRF TaxID=2780088 RepID=UPI00188043B8|nr:alginate export family protein [Mucilaginibacter sp. JRF]MBE9586237.1 alginate export family protein [Mucilaginibacter sp. JRF]